VTPPTAVTGRMRQMMMRLRKRALCLTNIVHSKALLPPTIATMIRLGKRAVCLINTAPWKAMPPPTTAKAVSPPTTAKAVSPLTTAKAVPPPTTATAVPPATTAKAVLPQHEGSATSSNNHEGSATSNKRDDNEAAEESLGLDEHSTLEDIVSSHGVLRLKKDWTTAGLSPYQMHAALLQNLAPGVD